MKRFVETTQEENPYLKSPHLGILVAEYAEGSIRVCKEV